MPDAAAIAGETLTLETLNRLNSGLRELALTAGPADAQLLADAQDWLNFMFGCIRGLESRLKGDADVVPEKALEGAIQTHFGNEQAYYLPLARALARDVRLLCFFPAIERGNHG